MSANTEGMVREGINAFKAGRKDEARALLSKAVEIDPYNEEGWLWLSGVVTSVDDQRTCLENVLAINPDNSRARSGLDFLIRQNPTAPPPAIPPSQTTPAAASSPASAMSEPPPPAMSPTSVEWDDSSDLMPDGGWHEAAAPASDDPYDEWVSGLQLGTVAPTAATTSPDPFAGMMTSASPFVGDDLPDLDDDIDPYGDNDGYAQAGAGAYGAAAGITFHPPSPGTDDSADNGLAPATTAMPAAGAPAARSAAALADISLEGDEIYLTEEEESLFPDIPKEIKATRMPGTNERVPLLLKLAVFILVPLNIAAALLFFWKVM